MEVQNLSLLPLLREIHALELPAAQLMAIYPWAFFACAVSAMALPALRPAMIPAARR
jgi:hypothetical protein